MPRSLRLARLLPQRRASLSPPWLPQALSPRGHRLPPDCPVPRSLRQRRHAGRSGDGESVFARLAFEVEHGSTGAGRPGSPGRSRGSRRSGGADSTRRAWDYQSFPAFFLLDEEHHGRRQTLKPRGQSDVGQSVGGTAEANEAALRRRQQPGTGNGAEGGCCCRVGSEVAGDGGQGHGSLPLRQCCDLRGAVEQDVGLTAERRLADLKATRGRIDADDFQRGEGGHCLEGLGVQHGQPANGIHQSLLPKSGRCARSTR